MNGATSALQGFPSVEGLVQYRKQRRVYPVPPRRPYINLYVHQIALPEGCFVLLINFNCGFGMRCYVYKYKKSFLLNEGGYRDGKLWKTSGTRGCIPHPYIFVQLLQDSEAWETL